MFGRCSDLCLELAALVLPHHPPGGKAGETAPLPPTILREIGGVWEPSLLPTRIFRYGAKEPLRPRGLVCPSVAFTAATATTAAITTQPRLYR
jgi:hypothetical protein